MARPLLACLLASACSVPNPWFGMPGTSTDATAGTDGTGAPPTPTSGGTTAPTTSSPTSTGDEPASTSAPESTSGVDATTGDLTATTTSATTTTGTTTTGADTTTSTSDDDDDDSDDDSDSDSDPALPPCDVADPDLIACYDFENEPRNEGELIDGSMYEHGGTMLGPAYAVGVEAQALLVTGSTLGSAFPTLELSPTALSIAAWVALKNVAPLEGAAIVDKTGQYALTIRKDAGLTCAINGVTLTHEVPFPLDAWTHVACVYSKADGIKLYMNGAPIKSGPAMGDVVWGPNPLHVGCGGPACQNRLVGARIDRVRLWRTAVSSDEVCAQAGAC